MGVYTHTCKESNNHDFHFDVCFVMISNWYCLNSHCTTYQSSFCNNPISKYCYLLDIMYGIWGTWLAYILFQKCLVIFEFKKYKFRCLWIVSKCDVSCANDISIKNFLLYTILFLLYSIFFCFLRSEILVYNVLA